MSRKKKLNVALIFGGTSAERGVSLRTGETIAQHLNAEKYNVLPIEISSRGKWLVASPTIARISRKITVLKATSTKQLIAVDKDSRSKIDVALLALHGPGGEDGTIQGMLELLKIPFTCSGVLASSLAMDKARTKRLLAAVGLPVAPDLVVKKKDSKKKIQHFVDQNHGRLIIKPNRMGSSLGVTIAAGRSAVITALRRAFRYDSEVLIEPYIRGREITVPVLGNDDPSALPVIEIIPWKKSVFYDYSAKYETGGSEHIIPAPITREQEQLVKLLAVKAHKALGCRGVTRSDFILDNAGRFYFLEINTIPGMTPTSLVPQAAAAAGISFRRLLEILIRLAFEPQ
ncbi:MAG: D-alanine--D-alanine ligase [Candidatus Doudnabacteria bacterium]|nr:D-alanine--D-alanine ligase [Candidatus Doudnabacteria bacterium]